MYKQQDLIQVFEYQTLYKGNIYNGVRFESKYFEALLKLNELHEGKYFNPVYNGIRFNSYVGVLQIDDLVIEVLPKIEGYTSQKSQWQNVLIEMLQVTHQLKINQIGDANVEQQNIHLLDIYFDWFLREVESLRRKGLVKQYYKETKNTLALKGKLVFAGHIRTNLVRQERFYTSHQVYDKDHLIHQLLSLALSVVEKFSKGTYRYGHCRSVQLNFPEVKSIFADEHSFTTISYNRKNQPYKIALELARLIILNYAPNIKSGSENMLALMFNMNELWENYILLKLQQQATGWLVKGQDSKRFWEGKTIRPDIVLQNKITHERFIIDAKWKNYTYGSVSINDLRQIYVYNEFWNAKVGMLLYPSHNETKIAMTGKYARNNYIGKIGLVTVLDSKGKLNTNIGKEIIGFFETVQKDDEYKIQR